ncbi:Peptidase C65 otubain [Trinorchestia longiramus]|nr:Peptidase C65 otubain [Trinorchestia longiramus]
MSQNLGEDEQVVPDAVNLVSGSRGLPDLVLDTGMVNKAAEMTEIDLTQTGACRTSCGVPASVPQTTVNQDELILAQEQKIVDEIKASTPMIGSKTDLKPLQQEFANDLVYSSKVDQLQKLYSHMRRTRPDGNCFLRGFIFSYLEHCIQHRDELTRFKKYIVDSKEELFALGFPKFTTEDFHDTFVEVLSDLESSSSLDRVESIINDAGLSDYLVVYLRLLISAHLQKNADFFTFFIEGGRTVEEFCKQEVEPMYRECDHLHIVALTTALAVPVCVLYMDRGDSDTAAPHCFPEDATKPLIYLLYRPGHYDVLYKAEDATGAGGGASSES